MNEFTITRTFEASREEIWRAWTDPTIAAKWWHPSEVTTKAGSTRIDLREGGSYAYTMVDASGTEYPTAGSYLEVRAPERLRFTWAEPGDDQQTAPVITVDLEQDADGRCTMRFHLAGIAADSGQPASVFDGWSEAFGELDAALVAMR